MTHSGGKQHEVGDRGQRFEVSYVDDHKRKVYGWTNEISAAKGMVKNIIAHPYWKHPRINDRREP